MTNNDLANQQLIDNNAAMLRDKSLWGLILAVVFMMVGVGMVVAQLPQRVVDLDGNGRSIGYIASAFAFSYLLLQVPVGSWSDKIGCKPLIMIGYVLCSATGLVFYYATSSNMIFFARFLQGAGEAPVWSLAPALLSLRFPWAKGSVMGIYNAALHMGLTLGPILGVALAKTFNSNVVFLTYALLCLVGAVVIYLLVDDSKDSKFTTTNQLDVRTIFKLIRYRQTLVSLLGITLYGASYGIFLTNVPVFMLEEKNFTSIHIGAFFSLFYVAISLSQIITGPLTDRFGRNMFMVLGLLTMAGTFMVIPAFSFPIILLVLMLASFGMGVFYLASMAFLNEIVPDSLKGTISGAYYLFWGCGYFFGPLIIAQIAESISFQSAMTGYSSCAILIAFLIINYRSVAR